MGWSSLPDLKPGIWVHFKTDDKYLVYGYGHDKNFEDRPVVQYRAPDDNGKEGPRLATRTAVSDDPDITAWWDLLHEPDKTKCLNRDPGETRCREGIPVIPRFQYVGPSPDVTITRAGLYRLVDAIVRDVRGHPFIGVTTRPAIVALEAEVGEKLFQR